MSLVSDQLVLFLYGMLVLKTAVRILQNRISVHHGADIQIFNSILAWIVILSVYGADTIAIDLSLSALIS
jgi:hypothetical protein